MEWRKETSTSWTPVIWETLLDVFTHVMAADPLSDPSLSSPISGCGSSLRNVFQAHRVNKGHSWDLKWGLLLLSLCYFYSYPLLSTPYLFFPPFLSSFFLEGLNTNVRNSWEKSKYLVNSHLGCAGTEQNGCRDGICIGKIGAKQVIGAEVTTERQP